MRMRIFVFALLSLLQSVSCVRQESAHQLPMGFQSASGSPFTAEISHFINDTLQEWRVPGVSIAVIDGENVFAEVCAQLNSDLTPTNYPGIWTCCLPRHTSNPRNSVLCRLNHQSPSRSHSRPPDRLQGLPSTLTWLENPHRIDHP